MTHTALILAAVASLPAAPVPGREARDRYGDPLPDGAVARVGTVRLRNVIDISRVALSPDGKLLVTAGDYGPLKVWNAASGALVRSIEPNVVTGGPPRHPSRVVENVAAFAFAEDSRRLLAVTNTGKLRACDVTDGTWGEALASSDLPEQRLRLASGRPSYDRTHFYLLTIDRKTTEVFAVGRDKPVYRLEAAKYGRVNGLDAAHRLLATVSASGNAELWDLRSDKVVWSARPPSGEFSDCAVSPDGKTVAGVFGPKEQRVWGKPAPPGTTLCAWDVATGKELFRSPGWEWWEVEYSPDGTRLISRMGAQVLLADAATGKLVHRLRGHGAWGIFGHSFSADGKRLATGGRDHTAIVWDLATGKAALDFESPRGPVDVLAFSPDGRTLFAGCAEDHTGGLWDAGTGRLRHRLVADGKGNPLAAAFTPDGRHLVVGYGVSRSTGTGTDWTARLWGAADGRLVREFPGHADGVHQLAVSPDGKRLATRDWGKKVRLWELGTGKLTREVEWADRDRPVALAFAGPDSLIGVSHGSGTAEVTDLASGKALPPWKGGGPAEVLALSPDGRRAVVSEAAPKEAPPREERCLAVREVASGKEVCTLTDAPHFGGLRVVAISPGGRTVALIENRGGVWGDGAVHLFDAATGKRLRTIRGHEGAIAGVAFSPDGRWLATGGWDSTALVWDLAPKP
jgi:WD40 repeat protein